MRYRRWLDRIGKITDPGLVDFIDLWDSATAQERVEFLKQHTPRLHTFEVQEFSQRTANQLREGVLLALLGLFEGSLHVDVDPDA